MEALTGKIITSKHIKNIFYRMEIRCPQIAQKAVPGQFIMLRPNELSVPFLGRPFGIADVDRERDTIGIVYQVVGDGTEMLSKLPLRTIIPIVGPLGHGFTIDPAQQRVLVVAGGIGIAPLLYLTKTLRAAGIAVKVLIGARQSDLLICTDDLFAVGCELEIMTDDGSVGAKGMVSEVLPDILAKDKFDFIYTCGRNIMMRKVSEMAAAAGIPCEVSLEEHMGCGVGICMSCVCDTKRGDGVERKERVCHEGPVFAAKDVNWHE